MDISTSQDYGSRDKACLDEYFFFWMIHTTNSFYYLFIKLLLFFFYTTNSWRSLMGCGVLAKLSPNRGFLSLPSPAHSHVWNSDFCPFRAQKQKAFLGACGSCSGLDLNENVLISASPTSAAGSILLWGPGEFLSEPAPSSASMSLHITFSNALQAAAFLHRISCRKCRKPHRPETKRHSRYCSENTCKMLETTTSYTCGNIYCRCKCALQSILDLNAYCF